jgi:hypothetical protein
VRSTVTRLPLLLVIAAAFASGCGGPEEPTPLPCTFNVTVSPAAFGAAGGTGSATITTGTGCSWNARAESGWLTITGNASGSGGGVVTFAVAANTEPAARGGSLTIAGQSLSIKQEAAAIACTFTIAPPSAALGKDGGTGSVAVGTSSSCGWTALSEDPWLAVIDGGTGTGSGTVTYGVARNSQVGARTGTIRIAGQAFRMSQSGDTGACTYSVAPVELSACMGSVELASQIDTQGGCPWTAEAGAAWITMTAGTSGSGPGTVRFRVSDNWDVPRNAAVMVRWPTPTAGQNVRIAQAGCYYSVTRDTFTVGATGANDAFEVVTMSEPNTCGGVQQNACVWTAVSDATWITVTSGMPRSGDDRVAFSVAANPETAPRSGAIRVRDKVVRISQAGR